MIEQKLKDKKAKLAVIGLGYVGLPIALAFAKKIAVIGFDINVDRVNLLNRGIDPSKELASSEFEGADIIFTDQLETLRGACCYIIAVPTPVEAHNMPDLKPLLAATRTVGKVLKKGDLVVFESTVFPGCTEENCVPILQKESGLKWKKDFKVGYSPERINPGDKEHTLSKIIKVVSGCDEQALDEVAKVYEMVVEAGVFKASSIKVAEAAKVIENTQRDLNIAFMNELSQIFDKLQINTYEVLEAAGTKWNFLPFKPGLVGGHCIGVDPYYLTYKANQLGHFPKVILSGREINDGMGSYIGKKTVQLMTQNKIDILEARVLVMGATFKENVSDIRNSKVVDVIKEIASFNIKVDVVDPYASPEEFEHEYGWPLLATPSGLYDAIVMAVAHEPYIQMDAQYLKTLAQKKAVVVDIKGCFKNKVKGLTYWSL